MEDAVKKNILKELSHQYYQALEQGKVSKLSAIHDEITRWEKELAKEEVIIKQPEIKFEGSTAIIPDEVKTQINRRLKGLCTYPEGCDKPIMSKGLCRMHYTRARKARLAQ